MPRIRALLLATCLLALGTLGPLNPAHASDAPQPGTPAYLARDLANMSDAYGRVTGPGGQLANPNYLPALIRESSLLTASQLLAQAATPTRPALDPGNVVPGWNVGNPLRAGWNGTRGRSQKVSFLNRYGALLRGTVYAPLAGATDPYTGARLTGPFPGVVITPGSVQGSEGMYTWLAEDLAERGYVVLTFDVQGEGTSETLPHTTGGVFPFCNPFAAPVDGNVLGCPGVPFQQLANFTTGTEDALDFFLSPADPYAALLDRSPDRAGVTPGRTTRIALIGHSMGAFAVSKLQATDPRVETVVALDKLAGPSFPALPGAGDNADNRPVVPALAVQSEYGFTVAPYPLSGGSSLMPTPGNPDPMRERRTGFDDWRAAGVDSMLVVPRASTHLEYADIPYVLPASRWGQDLTSAYVQAWLGRYLKHDGDTGALLGTSLRYLEPRGRGVWAPVTLDRGSLLSFYYCSAYALHDGADGHGALREEGDIGDIGGCTP
ncbi:alpha/beta fold hydrolase [Nocardioides pocheonensis]|uniref:alpha/beta fold hydrolase n=1 Tax=Nocardioides pocheonensis TaxID=661485 RepID=UPI00160B1350|nr:alpha/beta fold hydrolase [Nocardioides pocheonensis]